MPFVIPPVDISEFTRDVIKEDIKHTVSGSGIFDDMMETATKHLQAQFEGNRIRGEMYAQAYIQIYIETLKTAMQIWLQKPLNDKQVELADKEIALKDSQITLNIKQGNLADKEIALKQSQIALADKELALKNKQLDLLAKQIDLQAEQINSEKAKTALYKRQIEGYDENYKEKILKIVLDAFTVVFSVASEGFKGGLPKAITVSGINKITDIITNDLNIPATDSTITKIRNTTSQASNSRHNTTISDGASTLGFSNG